MMSRFYGEVEGSARTCATRCGSAGSGISGHIRGWNAGGRVSCEPADTGGKEDTVRVGLTGGSSGGWVRHLATLTELEDGGYRLTVWLPDRDEPLMYRLAANGAVEDQDALSWLLEQIA